MTAYPYPMTAEQYESELIALRAELDDARAMLKQEGDADPDARADLLDEIAYIRDSIDIIKKAQRTAPSITA